MPHPHPDGSRGRRPVRRVTEVVRDGRIPLRAHPEWTRAFPWVVQGITVRRALAPRPGLDRADPSGRDLSDADRSGHDHADATRSGRDHSGRPDDEDLDFGLFTGAAAGAVMKRWEHLARERGCARMVHARQVHGRRITRHEAVPPGLLLVPPCDGHATRQPGTLLAVSVADCVPVFAVAPRARAVLLLHAGWRGVAGGILEAGLEMLERDFGTPPGNAHIHMGPAICGRCYEVGPEVHEALGLPRPSSPAHPVDLRRVLARRALAAGTDPGRLTISRFCTRCADAPFFSHRGGDAGRQIAVLGIAGNDPAVPSVGLCFGCAHSRVTGNRRGSVFWLCRRSANDARFRRYPRLPVLRCPGFEPSPAGEPRTGGSEPNGRDEDERG